MKQLQLLKSSMAQTWVDVHSLLTKLVQWSHVQVVSIVVATVVVVAAVSVEIVAVTVVEIVGKLT